jgi:hypothetical protein
MRKFRCDGAVKTAFKLDLSRLSNQAISDQSPNGGLDEPTYLAFNWAMNVYSICS